jgi:hypothetical protein
VLVLVLKEFLADSDDEPNCGTVVRLVCTVHVYTSEEKC